MYLDNDRRPDAHAAARAAGGDPRRRRAGAVRGHLLPALVPPGALRRPATCAEANNNRVREIKVQAPRGKIVDRNGRVLVDNRPAHGGRGDARTSCRRRSRRATRSLQAPRQACSRMTPARDPHGRCATQLKALPFSAATVKQDVRRRTVYYLLEHQDDFPGVDGRAASSCASTRTTRSARTCSARSARSTAEQLKDAALPRRGAGRPRRPVGHRVSSTTASCAAERRQPGPGRRRSAPARRSCRRASPMPGRQLRLSLDLGVQKAGQQALAGGTGAGVRGDGRAQRRGARPRQPNPSFDPNVFSKGDQQARLQRGSTTRTTARRSPTARSRASIRPAPPSS